MDLEGADLAGGSISALATRSSSGGCNGPRRDCDLDRACDGADRVGLRLLSQK